MKFYFLILESIWKQGFAPQNISIVGQNLNMSYSINLITLLKAVTFAFVLVMVQK